ncbi:pre-miRNA 5'-monophosphate methyltransferase-like isoform X2 [Ornithodoros turicata]|uniref:pre-miRNA 5'-monophosphate methyltransferase-like isoform X2 n=1 Tax=Ornithodoros turicata TaxID=34597 RepID=UPI003139BC3A
MQYRCKTELTICLYKYLTSSEGTDVHVLGIDLDAELIQRAQQSNPFPNSVHYMCLDVMDEHCQPTLLTYLKKLQQTHFDITFCFSVTMWIHLNHGDVGLKSFLETTCRYTDFLLLEAQTWKCYRNASRRMRREGKKEFQNLDSLSMNINVVENIRDYIEGKCNMDVYQCFGETVWNRRVTLYKKKLCS